MTFFDEINVLVGDILKHKADSVEVKSRINELKKSMGKMHSPVLILKKSRNLGMNLIYGN